MRHLFLGILLAASACTGTIEMDTPGGGDDMPPPTKDIQLTVKDGAAPQAGVRVIFTDAVDTVLLDTVTDAQGFVKYEVAEANVTVIRTYPPVTPPAEQRPAEAYTYVGAKANDKLVFGNEQSLGSPIAMLVKVPDLAQGTVTITTSCGSGQGTGPNVAITVTDCPSMVDFYVRDQDQSSFYMRAANAPSVDLAGGVLSGALGATLSATNVPTGATVNAEVKVVAGTFELFSSGQKRIDQTTQNVNLPNLQGVDQLIVATIAPQGGGRIMVGKRDSYSGSPAVIDASANLLPTVSQVDYKPTTVTWTETGTGTPDAVMVMMNVTHVGATANNEYVRVVMAPYTMGTVRIPIIPDPNFNPVTGDQIAGSHALIQSSGGYTALRAGGFAVDSVVSTAPAGGHVTVSYSGNNPPGR